VRRSASESLPHHFDRSAVAGSIRTARHAGPATDTAPVSATTAVTAANVTASRGCTPKEIIPELFDPERDAHATISLSAKRRQLVFEAPNVAEAPQGLRRMSPGGVVGPIS
jgi:hypothetical protein